MKQKSVTETLYGLEETNNRREVEEFAPSVHGGEIYLA